MSDSLRHRNVAVAIIYDQPAEGFLLWQNKRWNGYAFPMKHFEQPGIDPGSVARQAVSGPEFPLNLADATVSPLDRFGECEFSEGARQYTYYDYYIYGIDHATLPGSLNPELRWFTYDQLQAASNVTWSTQSITRALVEDRRVAVALISRLGRRGREFLLVWSKNHEYFFPATRLRASLPEQAALQAVRVDLGYDGRIEVVDQAEVSDVQASHRFGPRQGRFHFHLCLLKLADDELLAGSPLEQLLNAVQAEVASRAASAPPQPYWGWFTESDLRMSPVVSPSVQSVLATVLQLAERNA